jgi:hypothetical protein
MLREGIVLAAGRIPVDGEVPANAARGTLGWWVAVVGGGNTGQPRGCIGASEAGGCQPN